MSKIFHESQKNPPVPPPTYLMYGPLYFLKKLSSYTFKASFKKVILMHSEKMKGKNMKKVCEIVFFGTLQDAIFQLHYRLTFKRL